MPCEMCGSEAATRPVLIEGTTMEVCPQCARYGTEAARRAEVGGRSQTAANIQRRAAGARPRDVYDEHPEALVPGYGTIVRQARDKSGMTQEDLGKKLNEKKTVIAKVEDESLIPSDALVRKIERALDIKLMGKPESLQKPPSGKGKGPITLGDLLQDAMKKEKGK